MRWRDWVIGVIDGWEGEGGGGGLMGQKRVL